MHLAPRVYFRGVSDKMKPAAAVAIALGVVLLVAVVAACSRMAHCQFGSAVPLPSPQAKAARYMWPAVKQAAVHTAAARVAEALSAAGIEFWPMCGTLIGSLRHGGVIPWDDDVDLAVWEADAPRVRAAVQAHKDAGSISRLGELLPGLGLRILQIEYADLSGVHVDVVSMRRQGDDDVVQSSAILRKLYPRDRFKASELLPIQPLALPFGPSLRLPAPRDARAAADRIAPGFMDKAVVTCNHAAYLNGTGGNLFLRKRSFQWPVK